MDNAVSALLGTGARVWMTCGWIKARVVADVHGAKLPAFILLDRGGDPKVVHIAFTTRGCDG